MAARCLIDWDQLGDSPIVEQQSRSKDSRYRCAWVEEAKVEIGSEPDNQDVIWRGLAWSR
jgi:hypothetical protein